MANEMLSGLLNQTSGGNFWQGTGAPTQGYGSYPSMPPQESQQPAAAPGQAPAQAGTGGNGIIPGATSTPPPQQANPDQWKLDMVAKNANARVAMFNRDLMQARVDQSSYPQGSDQWNKFQMQINKLTMQMQQEQARVGGLY